MDELWKICTARLDMTDGTKKCGHPRCEHARKVVTQEICRSCPKAIGDVIPMPSLRSIARDATQSMKQAIFNPEPASNEEVERRKAICDGCQYRQGSSCSVCGCNLILKRSLKVFECPMGLWEIKKPDPN